MAMFSCFSILNEKVKKKLGKERPSKENFDTLLAKLQHSVSLKTHDSEQTPFDLTVTNGFQKNLRCNGRVMSLESPVKAEVGEAYEAIEENENENEHSPSFMMEPSGFDLELHETVASKKGSDLTDKNQVADELEDQSDRYSRKSTDTVHSGHVSDPGIGKTDFFTSPKLKRSCSNLEKRDLRREINEYFSPSKSQSFEDFYELSANPMVNLKRSRSAMSPCSADRVMLKRHSSSQVLPSGSKKLWWKLFLWSHRNIHRKISLDTHEPKQTKALRHVQSSSSITTHYISEIIDCDDRRQNQNKKSAFLPQNQWFAFSTEASSFAMVDAWVKDLEIQEPVLEDDLLDDNAGRIAFLLSPDAGRSMIKTTSQLTQSNSNLSKDVLKANNMVQSLNPSSSVAHISCVGIKAIPVISHFSNLRSVNLSNNFIVSITSGCLPKSVQTLNLSRNKISTVDGLKELTRLRLLDLSYNCISRIGQGLSCCTLIKELHLAGNKISDVEGLHRLCKLTILDLSFNKISTTKALGQLVANYNSLQALNLLGNPIQRNVSDEQLNKSASDLLPRLVYLNKQPLKTQRAREILIDNVAKAALGNSKRSSVRRSMNRVGQGGSSSSRGRRSSASVVQKSRNRTRQ